MAIVVTGIGLVSALGELEATWKQLLAGASGIRLSQPFPDLAVKPLALIGNAPSDLTHLTQRVVNAALEDAGLVPPLPDCGVVVGSSRSQQGQWEQLAKAGLGHGYNAPTTQWQPSLNWLDTLPNAAAIAAAHLVGTTAPVLAPMAACATGVWAIARGCELLRYGECERVIVGAVETPITPLTLIGFERMGALAATGAYPFDRRREGMVLGEGGAILVLETAALAHRRGARIYGQVLGYGLTADGFHVSAPEPGSRAAIATVRQCLTRSQLTPDAIHYIHAHGTATTLNDRHEAALIQALFPLSVPISSTKGATGHTIGASGALGVVFCLMALKHQLLPPSVGLEQPEFDLNFVQSAQPATIQQALCFSFGFGGQNGAIALSTFEGNQC